MKKKTKKQIKMDFAFFLVAVSLILFACVSFEKQIEQPTAVLPAPEIEEPEQEIEIEEEEEIIEVDPCLGLYGNEKRLCIAIKENDFSFCENEDCIFEFAKNKSSVKACNELNVEANKYYCLSIVHGTEQCSLAKSTSGKDKCLADFASHTGDESLCRKITKNTEFSKQCYTAIAVIENDCSKCTFGTRGESILKDECRREYARLTGDTSCCEILWSKSWENDCYRQAALNNKDPSLCKGIENNYHRWQCYQGVFNLGYPKEIEICKKIQEIEWEERCIINIAVLENDPLICNELIRDIGKRNCLIKFD